MRPWRNWQTRVARAEASSDLHFSSGARRR